jgi:hypothetical protein
MSACTVVAFHLSCSPRRDDPLAVGFGLILLIVVATAIWMKNR